MKLQIKKQWFLLLLLLMAWSSRAQNIQLRNPSFEDIPKMSSPPLQWEDCGFPYESPPDVHPAPEKAYSFWGVTQKPYDGNTYLGMVVRDNETWERISQRLSSPLKGGQCYEFSIYLSRSALYRSESRATGKEANFTTPIKLRIWGGVGPCARTELLAESILIKNTRWLRFDFLFHPTQDLYYITFEAFYNTPTLFPYNGNILLDKASAIVEVPCEEEIPLIAEVPPPPPDPTPKNDEQTSTSTPPPPPPKKDTNTGTFSQLDATKLKEGETLRIENLYFLADSSNFTPESVPVLEDVYNFLKQNPKVVVEIGGHTNSIPPHSYCDRLSTARAKAVADYLINKGIEPSRVKYKGYGKRKPVANNDTPEGRKKNQRVEIKILSTGNEQ